MNFQVSDGENYQKILRSEIEAEELSLSVKKVCKHLVERLNIPGFRKGKAPQSIVENFVGLETILNDAAEELIQLAYIEGIKELALEPIEKPEIDIIQLKLHEPLIFNATFTAKPQVKLGQYLGLPLSKQVAEVTEEEIDADIETQRRRLSRLTEMEEGVEAALGDVLIIDYEGFHQNMAFEGGQATNYELELGSKRFIPGFEEQLIGVKVGEEREINVVFPEEYNEQALAGQQAVFKVAIKNLKRRIWPELDNDLAQELSETAETMEDLRHETASRLLERNIESAEQLARKNILKQAADNIEVDIPPLLIKQQLDSIMHNISEHLLMQGIQMEPFLEYSKTTKEEFRKSYLSQAEDDVLHELMLDAVAKAEDIIVSEEEIEQELKKLADYYQQPPELIKDSFTKSNRMEMLIDDIKRSKAANLIFDQANID